MLRLEFLYVVTGELGFVKIGVCRPPEMPADAIRTGSIRPIEIVWVAATNGDAHAIEREAHLRLGASRQADEWFSIPPRTAIRAVEWAARELEHTLLNVGPINQHALPARRKSMVGSVERFIGNTYVRVAMMLVILGGAVGLAFANRDAIERFLNSI